MIADWTYLLVYLKNYNENQPTNEFLGSLVSNSIIPYILQPTRLISNSKTFIDNIFSNVLSCEAISGNITATISDHLSQFLFASNVLSNPLCNKSNILERDWSKFNKENFILDYFDKNWSEILQLDQQNVNLSMDSYLDHMNAILDIHVPYKKVNNHYFDINWNHIKNTWKGIKSILSIKSNPSDILKILNRNDSTITKLVEIANVFNNYFFPLLLKIK